MCCTDAANRGENSLILPSNRLPPFFFTLRKCDFWLLPLLQSDAKYELWSHSQIKKLFFSSSAFLFVLLFLSAFDKVVPDLCPFHTLTLLLNTSLATCLHCDFNYTWPNGVENKNISNIHSFTSAKLLLQIFTSKLLQFDRFFAHNLCLLNRLRLNSINL